MNEIQIKHNNSLGLKKPFKIVSDFNPSGDQPDAIDSIVKSLNAVSYTHLTLPTILLV